MVKQKRVQKKKKLAKKSSPTNLKWSFPKENVHLIRIETFVLTICSFFMFTFMFLQFDQRIFPATVLTLIFLGVFSCSLLLMKKLRNIKFSYQLKGNHLVILKTINGKKSKSEVKLKKINFSKFDRIFLGGYLLTDDKRHSIYFNNLEELDKLEEKINNL